MNTMVENYTKTSRQIEKSKNRIVGVLANLHAELCTLAALERALETERLQGVTREGSLLPHNDPALVEFIEAHNQQLQVPSQKVWVSIDSAMQVIYQANAPGVTPTAHLLPDVFKNPNRIEILKGKG